MNTWIGGMLSSIVKRVVNLVFTGGIRDFIKTEIILF